MLLRVKFAQVRDAALLIGGLTLLGYETLGVPEPRIALVTLAAVMMGLPATFIADRWFVGGALPPASPPDPTDPPSSTTGTGPTA